MSTIKVIGIDLQKILKLFNKNWSLGQTRTSHFDKTGNMVMVGGSGSGKIYFIDIHKKQLAGSHMPCLASSQSKQTQDRPGMPSSIRRGQVGSAG